MKNEQKHHNDSCLVLGDIKQDKVKDILKKIKKDNRKKNIDNLGEHEFEDGWFSVVVDRDKEGNVFSYSTDRSDNSHILITKGGKK